MRESILTLYSEEKFDRIVFYLKEHEIICTEALENFNFDELASVPGVSEELISEAKLFFFCLAEFK